MRRPNAQLQSDRRAEILAAAERCFVRSGFHQTSMQEICAEAGMSPGNLYRYFPSKEALIAGISERNRANAAAELAAVAEAPSFFAGLAQLAAYHVVERPMAEVALCVEIMAESRRNPEVARVFDEIEGEVKGKLMGLLTTAAAQGEISRDINFEAATDILMALGDGISWRRAADPSFNAETALPLILQMVRCLLTEPRPKPSTEESET